MRMLVILLEIAGNIGAAFMGAEFLTILCRLDIAFGQLLAASVVGGVVWWAINSGWERYAKQRISAWPVFTR